MANALEQYYRQPEIYISLPNGGEFYPEGSLEIPETGEIPVYAMTAKDDVILKTPDALISGEAIAQIIKSCVPAIKDPWQMPASDVDYILVAIRIASYGNDMELEYTCDKCESEFNYAVNLDYYIQKLSDISFDSEVQVIPYGQVKVHIKPLSYVDLSLLQRKAFEEQQAINVLGNIDDRPEEERKELFNEILNSLSEINVSTISSGIKGIELPDGTMVSDKDEIIAFVNNTSVKLFKKIQAVIQSIREKSFLDPVDVECPECNHKFTSPLIFDYSHFFG